MKTEQLSWAIATGEDGFIGRYWSTRTVVTPVLRCVRIKLIEVDQRVDFR